MVTRKNAQLIVTSTAGTERRSPFLWAKVEAGRQAVEAGVTDGIAYLEWSAGDGDPAAVETWEAAIPAMARTIDEATIRGDFQGMPLHEFLRSFLDVWTTAMGDPVIPLQEWERMLPGRRETRARNPRGRCCAEV